jgi:hypothetical protein
VRRVAARLHGGSGDDGVVGVSVAMVGVEGDDHIRRDLIDHLAYRSYDVAERCAGQCCASGFAGHAGVAIVQQDDRPGAEGLVIRMGDGDVQPETRRVHPRSGTNSFSAAAT